jgi:bifunctional DNase/RNase
MIEVQLTRIIISEVNENQVVFLKELDGERQFPIMIGIFEATAIDRRVKSIERPRPLTHDLLVATVDALGGQLESVLINDLQRDTYFAALRVRSNDEMIEIDARPSDAIAIAMTCDPPLPIYVEEEVLRAAAASMPE